MGLAEKVTQTVESTDNQTPEYRWAGDTSTIEALMLGGSLSAFPPFMRSCNSQS